MAAKKWTAIPDEKDADERDSDGRWLPVNTSSSGRREDSRSVRRRISNRRRESSIDGKDNSYLMDWILFRDSAKENGGSTDG